MGNNYYFDFTIGYIERTTTKVLLFQLWIFQIIKCSVGSFITTVAIQLIFTYFKIQTLIINNQQNTIIFSLYNKFLLKHIFRVEKAKDEIVIKEKWMVLRQSDCEICIKNSNQGLYFIAKYVCIYPFYFQLFSNTFLVARYI